MPLGYIRVDAAEFPEVETACLRCGQPAGCGSRDMPGVCRRAPGGDAPRGHTVDAEYVPR